MATSTLDGTIEEADLKRARGGVSVFNAIRFRLDDGSSRTLSKYVAAQNVADALKPGASGRFYLFGAFDLKGVHGFRDRGGASSYGFPKNNTKIFALVGLINFLWVAFRLATEGEVPVLGAGLMVLGAAGYYLMSKGEREARGQFDSDTGYTPRSDMAAATWSGGGPGPAPRDPPRN